jgi:hypothetical protein
MMECAEIKGRLSEYLDGMLDSHTSEQVESHLRVCKTCQDELSSLKTTVGELNLLEPLRAPEDFLEKLHARIERRLTFRRLLHVLFVPARIKIPLEAAAATVIVILIFVGLNVPPPKQQLAKAPEPAGQVRLAKKAPVDRVEAPAEVEPYRASPPSEQRKAVKPEDPGEIFEVALILGTETPGRPDAPGVAMRSAPLFPEEEGFREQEADEMAHRSAAEVALERAPDTGIKAEKPKKEREPDVRGPEKSLTTREGGPPVPSLDEAMVRVTALVGSIGGTVVSIDYERQSDRPQSIDAEIPADRYEGFYEALGRLGHLQTPPRTLSDKDQRRVRIRIRFIPPE